MRPENLNFKSKGYIHTVIFDGLPSCGKTYMEELFQMRTGGAYLSYEGGVMSYMAKAKEKLISNPIPAAAFCADAAHTLTVFLHVRPSEIVRRVVSRDCSRFDATQKYLLYKRVADVLVNAPINFLIVENGDFKDRSKAIEEILSYLRARKYARYVAKRTAGLSPARY